MYVLFCFVYISLRLTINPSFELFILSFYVQAKIREKKITVFKRLQGYTRKKNVATVIKIHQVVLKEVSFFDFVRRHIYCFTLGSFSKKN